MTHIELDKYLLSKPESRKEYPFGEGNAVYKTQVSKPPVGEWKMFAIVREDSDPINISLKCDPVLAEDLRAKYESVMPGYHLNKKHWNTMILSGQLTDDEVYALIDHSYQLVAGD